MARSKKSVVFLDTHIVVWLYENRLKKFSKNILDVLETNNLCISSIVKLELQYLYEIGRISESPEKILSFLLTAIDLQLSDTSLPLVVETSLSHGWTRDPFDRLIVAEADFYKAKLVSADTEIKKNYKKTVW